MVLVIDNYDSFTYNLVDLLQQRVATQVFRNDQLSLQKVASLQPEGILISPGPGRPEDSGISQAVVREYANKLPILGICLGHQLIGEWLGAHLVQADRPMHGRTSFITHNQEGLFTSLPSPLKVMRYHSLILAAHTIPNDLVVTAHTDAGEVMGIRHKHWPLTGVQFHPESILSEGGSELIGNWLDLYHVT